MSGNKKEMFSQEDIQNAEDTEAREVRLLYNSRRINDSTDEQTPAYNRFFKVST